MTERFGLFQFAELWMTHQICQTFTTKLFCYAVYNGTARKLYEQGFIIKEQTDQNLKFKTPVP